jgi:WD40-like Beta Propeller Repeat
MADGTRLRQLTHNANVGYPRLSPNGGRIVMNASLGSSPRGNLFTADPETGDLHQIRFGKSSDLDGYWSHDGRWIYFDSDRTGRPEIWKVASGGGPEIQVTKNGGSHPMESPDEKYLYYGKEFAGKPYLWRMSLATEAEERLFPSEFGMGDLAMGSQHLYFVASTPNVHQLSNAIYSYDLSTGRICKVVEGGIRMNGAAPSPDEKHLLYAVVNNTGGDLLTVNGLEKR